MEYKHIKDCWSAVRAAETVEQVKKLFEEFPRWSGDWGVELEDGAYVVTNHWFDEATGTDDTDRETLDIPVARKWFIKFEQQGNEEVIIAVTAATEKEAYDKAAWAYIGNTHDIFEVTEDEARMSDCMTIGEDQEEYDFDEEE